MLTNMFGSFVNLRVSIESSGYSRTRTIYCSRTIAQEQLLKNNCSRTIYEPFTEVTFLKSN